MPQLGDEVVYVRRGHQENRTRLAELGEELPEAPWDTITCGGVSKRTIVTSTVLLRVTI